MSSSVRLFISKGAFFFLLIFSLFPRTLFGQTGSIQDKPLTISVRNLPLSAVLKKLQKFSGVTIYFNTTEVASLESVSFEAVKKPFSQVLKEILEPRGFEYQEINSETVAIASKKAINSSSKRVIESTTWEVYGRLLNKENQPIPGATVLVSGTKNGITTGSDGVFRLEDVSKTATLTITNISYLTETIAVKGRHDLGNIVLKEYVAELDETVVKGYYKTTKRFNTGTVYAIDGEEIAKQPVTNPMMALQGRVPNLVINPTSGLPNAVVNFQLRGQNSLSSASLRSEPLIIVDGIPFQNSIQAGAFGSLAINNDRISALNFINPNDIEQITILSDADATSIYGSRGGNGVILITTKKGKTGATAVSLGLSTSISEVNNKLDLLNTRGYIQLRRQAYLNDDLAIPDKSFIGKNYSNFDLTVWDTARNTDWQKEFLGRTATSYVANVSIQGGNRGVQYLLSGTYNTQNYVFPGKNKYENIGSNLNITGNSQNNKLRAQLGTSFTYNNTLSPSSDLTRLAVTLAPNAPSIYNTDGTLNWAPNPESVSNMATWSNPYAKLLRTSTTRTSSFRESGEVSYQILNNLSIKTAVGYSEITLNSISLIPIASFDPSVTTTTGFALRSNTKVKSFTVDPQLNYNITLGKGRLDALVGANYQSQSQLFETIRGEGYTSDALLNSISSAQTTTGSNTSLQYKYNGIFGRLSYNLNNKYIVNLTGRRDGSSRFGPNYQFGNFWSVGGAWILSQEKTISNLFPAVSFSKLRFSYGTSGNDGISDYQFIELYEPYNGYIYQNGSPLRSNGVVNPDYHWESVNKLEVALESGFLQDRIFLTVAYWRTRAGDQLGTFPLPATGGAVSIIRNQDARIQNMGWDFVLNTKNVVSTKFNWTSNIIVGIQNNKLLARPEGVYNGYGFNRFVVVGEPFTGFAAVRKSKGVNTANGLYQFEGKDGNTTDNGNNFEQAVKINTRPLTMGISNNLSYKNLSISLFIQLTKQIGRNITYDPAFTNYNPGSFSSLPSLEYGNLPVEILNNWKNPGDVAEYQKLTSGNFSEPLKTSLIKAVESDAGWVDASFIKLRNISISYSLSEKFKKKLHLNNFSIYLQAQNVITISNYKGLDPEVQNATSLPLLRTINAGIQIGI